MTDDRTDNWSQACRSRAVIHVRRAPTRRARSSSVMTRTPTAGDGASYGRKLTIDRCILTEFPHPDRPECEAMQHEEVSVSAWKEYQRRGGALPDPVPAITLRRQAIALNVAFVSMARLADKPYVRVFVDPEAYRLGFKFDARSTDDNAIRLGNDGGGRTSSRAIQATGIMKEHRWLAAAASLDDPRLRRFEPTWDPIEAMWIVSVAPPFENRVSERSEIPAHVRGIYRYRRGEEIVYIGRGGIRSRHGSPEREDWDFETVEYSLVSSEQDQERWETFWLDRFVGTNGRLPTYNRIGGKRTE
jgi:hypothetical protein